LAEHGTTSVNCTAFISKKTGKNYECNKKCDNGSPLDNHYMVSKSYRVKKGVQSMQEELLNFGPFSVSIAVYDDFSKFFKKHRNGIYKSNKKKAVGNHAVRLVGWGTQDGTNYWTVGKIHFDPG
jgi:5'-3' exonuclease